MDRKSISADIAETRKALARMTAAGASASPAATPTPTVVASATTPALTPGGSPPSPPASPPPSGGGRGMAKLVLRAVGGGNISGSVDGEELDGIPPYEYAIGSLVELSFNPKVLHKISRIQKDGVVVETQRTMTFPLNKTTIVSVEFELKTFLRKEKVEDAVADPGLLMLRESKRPSPAFYVLMALIAGAMLLLYYFQTCDREKAQHPLSTATQQEVPSASDPSAPISDCPTRQVGSVTAYDGTKGTCSFTVSSKFNAAVIGKNYKLKEANVGVWHSEISCQDFYYHGGPNSEMKLGQTTPWECTSVVVMNGKTGSFTLTN